MSAPAPQAGSTAWFLCHDLRLAWRDFRSTFGSLGNRALTGLLLLLVGLMHVLVYPIAADFGALADTRGGLDEVYGVALPMAGFALLLLMTAQTLNGTTKLLYARGDLDLLLSSPVPASRILISRALSVATGAFTSAAIFVLPLADAGIAAGHPRLLALYPTLVSGALLSAAVGLTIGLALFRSIGPRRTRLAAQLLATLIGAVFMIGLQVRRAFPGVMASGIVPRHGWMHEAALLPVRAALAEPMSLLVWFAVGLATFTAAALLLGPAFAASVKAAVGSGAAGPGSAPRTGSRDTPWWRPRRMARHAGWSFGRSAGASLRSKEWRLIGRDPWVASQILLQILYMTPMIAILWSGSGNPALAIAPTVVVVTFQVASSLTWLSLSGEDAPDLLHTAPITAGVVRRSKIEAVGCLTLGIVALPLIYLATVSVAATILSVGLGAVGLCTAVMLHLWHGAPARRSAFAARHRESKLMALIEMSFSLLFGLTTALSVLGTAWGLAPFAVVGAILLWLKPRGFPTEAGAAR